MTVEHPNDGGYLTLTQFDAMRRENSGRNFHALICEKFGTDKMMYQRITEEMIGEQAKSRKADPDKIKSEVARGIMRSLDGIVSDPVLRDNPDKMNKAHAGMVIWLDLLREMLQN
ncbi:MAG: hypothetical protein WA057_01485 [Candidatus Magasanikiibacteriota bacterium]